MIIHRIYCFWAFVLSLSAMITPVVANTIVVQRTGLARRAVVVHRSYLTSCAREKVVRYYHSRKVVVYRNKCR